MTNLKALLLLATASALASADSTRPRGVGPDFAKYFKSKDTFACISNPSIKLSISQVNDDYCDCPDGSDEPGTAACAHLSPLSPAYPIDINVSGDINTNPALPGFYCKNKGHQPSYVPFYHVNDGVCDYTLCCDGSDEYEKVGGISCPDKCKEIGKEWRKHDEARKKAMSSALKKRKELVTEAARLKQEVEARISSLGTEIGSAEIQTKNLEAQLAEVEKKERGKVIKAPGKAGKLSVLVGLAKDRVEELRTKLLDVRTQRNLAKERLAELEGILAKFKEEYNPNFNDEGVKRAVRSWEEYSARDTIHEKEGDENEPSGFEKDLDEIIKPDSESEGINWVEFEKPDESDLDLLYDFEAYLPLSLRTWLDTKLRDLRSFMIENGMMAPSSDPNNQESAELQGARSSLQSAKDKLSGLQSDLSTHTTDLAKDYGLDSVFRALKGKCIAKDSGEYTYELCWMDRTTQKSKKGHGDTGLGNFERLDKVTVDDQLPADGRGLGSGERVAMRYENGQHCWNGPARSTVVVLACHEKDEIWKVTEEEKCVYRMEVGTPAVCENDNGAKKGNKGKDEL